MSLHVIVFFFKLNNNKQVCLNFLLAKSFFLKLNQEHQQERDLLIV